MDRKRNGRVRQPSIGLTARLEQVDQDGVAGCIRWEHSEIRAEELERAALSKHQRMRRLLAEGAMTVADVAAELGMTNGAVRKYVSRYRDIARLEDGRIGLLANSDGGARHATPLNNPQLSRGPYDPPATARQDMARQVSRRMTKFPQRGCSDWPRGERSEGCTRGAPGVAGKGGAAACPALPGLPAHRLRASGGDGRTLPRLRGHLRAPMGRRAGRRVHRGRYRSLSAGGVTDGMASARPAASGVAVPNLWLGSATDSWTCPGAGAAGARGRMRPGSCHGRAGGPNSCPCRWCTWCAVCKVPTAWPSGGESS